MSLKAWKESDERAKLINRGGMIIDKNPLLAGRVYDTISLCDSEIAVGESMQNEYELAMSHLKEIAETNDIKL